MSYVSHMHLTTCYNVMIGNTGVCDTRYNGCLFVRQPGRDWTCLWPRSCLAARGCCLRGQRAYLSRTTTCSPRHRGLACHAVWQSLRRPRI